jgi:hypothetical protein
MAAGDGGVEQDRFGLAARRVAVELAHARAVVGVEDVGAGDAVPGAARREPHQALVGGQRREELLDQARVGGAELGGLVPGSGERFGGPGEGARLRGRQDQRLEREAGPTGEPGIGQDPRGGQLGGERSVAVGFGARSGHAPDDVRAARLFTRLDRRGRAIARLRVRCKIASGCGAVCHWRSASQGIMNRGRKRL